MKHNYNAIGGYQISPGIYELNGATPVDGAVNFTITSTNATYCELVLFHREEAEPYAVIPFPQEYRIGHVFSMLVHGLDIEEFEYAYRMDGPNCPEKGEIFNAKLCYLPLFSMRKNIYSILMPKQSWDRASGV